MSGVPFTGIGAATGAGLPASSPDAIERAERIRPFIPAFDETYGLGPAALWWAQNVGGVFPLTPANAQGANPGKTPMKDLGEGGQWERSSRDPEQIVRWWHESPASNVGLVTQANGILLIDVDPRAGGDRALRDWCNEFAVDLADVPRSVSPRGDGGAHLYWRLPADTPRYKVGPFLDGVDVPWQVPVPPSLRWVQTGARLNGSPAPEDYDFRPYGWAAGDPRSLPVAPQQLVSAVVNYVGRKRTADERREAKRIGDTSGELPTTEWFMENGLRQHRRNVDAYALACRLWRECWPHRDSVVHTMQVVWDHTVQDTAFPWSEALSRVDWALHYMKPQIEKDKVLKTRDQSMMEKLKW